MVVLYTMYGETCGSQAIVIIVNAVYFFKFTFCKSAWLSNVQCIWHYSFGNIHIPQSLSLDVFVSLMINDNCS